MFSEFARKTRVLPSTNCDESFGSFRARVARPISRLFKIVRLINPSNHIFIWIYVIFLTLL